MRNEKAVLIDLGIIRICEFDKLNVKIERLEEVFNPKSKQREMHWQFKGYSDTILNALKAIVRNEWLIDKNAVNGLKTYLKQVEESNNKVLQAMK